MNLSQFYRLTKRQKLDLLTDYEKIVYLGYRIVGISKTSKLPKSATIYLYWYDGIFIEMCISMKDKKNVILNAFTGVSPLYFYLDWIDISDLNRSVDRDSEQKFL